MFIYLFIYLFVYILIDLFIGFYKPLGVCHKNSVLSIIQCLNDALNTFYLRLYGVRHMVKDHSDSEKGNTLPPHRLLLSISSKGSFICTIPQT